MRINFILPRVYNQPVGGVKVVYQYAKRMAKNNYDVHIYFYIGQLSSLKNLSKLVLDSTIWRNKVKRVTWFDLAGVKLHFDQTYKDIVSISEGKIIATHWSTAEVVYKSHCLLSNKFYFIQDYETFDPAVTKEKLDATWNLPLKKIIISKWLYKKGIELGLKRSNMFYIPNFIDTNDFPIVENKTEERNLISFLWHKNPRKQADMGIAIAKKIKKRFPELNIVMFGTNITEFPDQFRVVNNANIAKLNNIYRHSIIYFMPSSKEGWGLTGMEAMACGAAVVSIDNGGIWEYANDSSAVIVNNEEEKLFNEICNLIDDVDKRKRMVLNAYSEVKKFTFDKSYKKFMSVIDK